MAPHDTCYDSLLFAGGSSRVSLVSSASHAQIVMAAIHDPRAGTVSFRRVLLCGFRPQASGKAMSSKPPITVSRLDLERIEALLERLAPADAAKLGALRAELDRADVVEPADVPAHTVTMNSTVTFADESNDEKLTLTLVYPAAAGTPGTVSILAPVGSALLGLARGQQIDWPTPDGHKRRLKVLEISYQPEAAGHLHR
jgi:regulator of nucleoside diphosphate kinase